MDITAEEFRAALDAAPAVWQAEYEAHQAAHAELIATIDARYQVWALGYLNSNVAAWRGLIQAHHPTGGSKYGGTYCDHCAGLCAAGGNETWDGAEYPCDVVRAARSVFLPDRT